jgi:hypothetical protein
MQREFICTHAQLVAIYAAWETRADVPAKGKKSIVAWPGRVYAEITRHKSTGDARSPMFKIQFIEVAA